MLTQDPIGLAGGVNLYAFAGNNPIAFNDPFGLLACPPCETVPAGPAAAEGAGAATGAEVLGRGAILALPFINDEVPDTRTHLTYTRTNETTGQVYVGRTSGFGSAEQLAADRARSHPDYLEGFGAPVVDKVATGKGGYEAIRGREQQMIDARGGIGSPAVANKIRAVSKINPAGPLYHKTANERFGEIAPYSGKMGFMFRIIP